MWLSIRGLKSLCLSTAIVVAAGALVLPVPTALAAETHQHKDDDPHKEDEHAGPKIDLGTAKIGAFSVQVTRLATLKPGEEAIFILKPTGPGKLTAVRAWVGIETGQGSIKTKAEEEKPGEWHAHHPVSKPMPAKSKLWVELEVGTTKSRASFDLKL